MLSSVNLASRRTGALSRFAVSSSTFVAATFLLEIAVTSAVAVLTGLAYHVAVHGAPGDAGFYANIGALVGIIYASSFLTRGEYGIDSLLEGRRTNSHLLMVWTFAFAGIAIIGFLTKTSALFSRGWIALFYLASLFTVIVLNTLIHRGASAIVSNGLVRRRRLMLVGTDADINRLEREIADGAASVYVAARIVLPADVTAAQLTSALDSALGNARALGIEDVIISDAVASGDALEQCVSAFNLLPVAIHIGASTLIAVQRCPDISLRAHDGAVADARPAWAF